jgi:hypothetical protein
MEFTLSLISETVTQQAAPEFVRVPLPIETRSGNLAQSTKPISREQGVASSVARSTCSKRRVSKGAPERRAHQSLSGSSDVPLSAAPDRRWSAFLHACSRRPRQRLVGLSRRTPAAHLCRPYGPHATTVDAPAGWLPVLMTHRNPRWLVDVSTASA